VPGGKETGLPDVSLSKAHVKYQQLASNFYPTDIACRGLLINNTHMTKTTCPLAMILFLAVQPAAAQTHREESAVEYAARQRQIQQDQDTPLANNAKRNEDPAYVLWREWTQAPGSCIAASATAGAALVLAMSVWIKRRRRR
jgi:hypothetical protein